MQLGRLEAFNSVSVVYRVNFLASFLNKNYGDGKNANGRLKSANSSNISIKAETRVTKAKRVPLNLHKRSNNANIDLPAAEIIRPKALQLSAMIRLASDRHRLSTTKNFLANFLKQELRI